MKVSIICSLVVIVILNLFYIEETSSNDELRRERLIKITDEEIATLNNMTARPPGNKNPLLFLRMAELYLEKARLIKDEEMQRFMAQSESNRRRIDKKKWFSNSRRYFYQAQKICTTILRRFPQTQSKAEVYYIMGSNEVEFQNPRKAKQYFTAALSGSTNNADLRSKVRIALAELHYNDGEFPEAIRLYEQSLSLNKDKWWTKDSYNLAWSYFKVNQFDRAIDKMKEVVQLSKDSKFVDVGERAMKDLGVFAAAAGKVDDAEKFIDRSGGDAASELLKMGKHQLAYGKHSLAEKTFIRALARARTDEQKVDIHVELLKLYERSGQYDAHLKSAHVLMPYYREGKLDPEQKTEYHSQIKKMAAVLQNQVTGKTYVHNKKIRNQKATQAVSYFDLMQEADPQHGYMHNFTAGETLFAVERFVDALNYYDRSQQQAIKAGNTKIAKESLKGLMVSIEQKSVPESVKEKYTRQVMEYYISNDPRSPDAYKIYQRLFSEYMDKGQVSEAENILVKFRNSFPNDHVKQEAMIARLMDHYQKNKDRSNFSKWVERIRRKEFIVSEKYARQLNRILLSMQFENVQGLVSQGDKKKALEMYVQIYKEPETSEAAKRNAAYNIMLLFHELRDYKRSYGWADRALSVMNSKEILRFQNSFLVISGELFNRRNYDESATLYEKTLLKICKEKSNQKVTFFKNAAIIYLANLKVEEARHLIRQTAGCGIPQNAIDEVEIDVLKSFVELGRWNSVEDQLSRLEGNRKNWPELIVPSYRLKQELIRVGKMDSARQLRRKIDSFYERTQNKKTFPLEALDIIAHFKIADLNRDLEKFSRIKLAFPEDQYNKLLKEKFDQLDKLTTTALAVLSIGSGKGLVRIYRVLIQAYQEIANEMRGFVPPGKSEEYVKSFNQTMVQISGPILQKVNEYKQEAVRQITRNNILSNENYMFLLDGSIPIKVEYDFSPGAVVMDRGGRR